MRKTQSARDGGGGGVGKEGRQPTLGPHAGMQEMGSWEEGRRGYGGK